MSEEISDFAGAGANVVAKGVSIAQYRDDKSRRRIEAYDAFEENAKKVYNESFSIAKYAIQYAAIMHDEDRYRKMKKEREKRYCFAGYDEEVGDIETFLDNLDKPHLRTWYEAKSAADTFIGLNDKMCVLFRRVEVASLAHPARWGLVSSPHPCECRCHIPSTGCYLEGVWDDALLPVI